MNIAGTTTDWSWMTTDHNICDCPDGLGGCCHCTGQEGS